MKGQFQLVIVLLLIAAAIGVSFFILNNQKTGQSYNQSNVLTQSYFLDPAYDAEVYKGLTLPFPVGTTYTLDYPYYNYFKTVEFIVPENTQVVASLPGKVAKVEILNDTVRIRIIYSSNISVDYLIGKTTATTAQLPSINKSVKRGDMLVVTDGSVYKNTQTAYRNSTLSVTVNTNSANFTASDLWATGKPMYFRQQ